MSKLTDFEREILLEACGLKPRRPWGAAVGQAVEFLVKFGYLDADGRPTPLGNAEARDDPEEDRQRADEAQAMYNRLVGR